MKTFIILAFLLLVTAAYADPPQNFDAIMAAGEDYDLTLLYLDKNNVPVNLTGNTYSAQFRSSPAPSGSIFANYSVVVSDPSSGVIDVRLSKSQTMANSSKLGQWDLKETNSAGRTTYLVGGKAYVKPTITR